MNKCFSCTVNLKKILILKDFHFFPNYDPCHFTIAKWQIPVSSWKWTLLLICVTIAFLVLDVIFLFSKVKYVSKSLTMVQSSIFYWQRLFQYKMYTHNILLWNMRPSRSTFLHISAASSGEGNGTPLQYSCLENPMDGGAW